MGGGGVSFRGFRSQGWPREKPARGIGLQPAPSASLVWAEPADSDSGPGRRTRNVNAGPAGDSDAGLDRLTRTLGPAGRPLAGPIPPSPEAGRPARAGSQPAATAPPPAGSARAFDTL